MNPHPVPPAPTPVPTDVPPEAGRVLDSAARLEIASWAGEEIGQAGQVLLADLAGLRHDYRHLPETADEIPVEVLAGRVLHLADQTVRAAAAAATAVVEALDRRAWIHAGKPLTCPHCRTGIDPTTQPWALHRDGDGDGDGDGPHPAHHGCPGTTTTTATTSTTAGLVAAVAAGRMLRPAEARTGTTTTTASSNPVGVGDRWEGYEGQHRIGGPVPEFWVLAGLSVVLVPVLFVAVAVYGPIGLVVASAWYVAANVVAERLTRRRRYPNGRRPVGRRLGTTAPTGAGGGR